jgi:CAAX prenyl protease-like protein
MESMMVWYRKICASPLLVRILPFVVFAALTMVQGRLGDSSQYWIYAAKTLIGAWLLWLARPYIKEMRWTFSWEAGVVGIAIFLVWVGFDGHYPMSFEPMSSFHPERTYGPGSALAIAFLAIRLLGSSLVVPPLEEVFYRSFLYRYLIKSDFQNVSLGRWEWKAFLICSLVFGLGHYEWLPGILCGLTYQGLVCRKGRLGDAMTAHAITNFLLGIWVITRQAYHFW